MAPAAYGILLCNLPYQATLTSVAIVAALPLCLVGAAVALKHLLKPPSNATEWSGVWNLIAVWKLLLCLSLAMLYTTALSGSEWGYVALVLVAGAASLLAVAWMWLAISSKLDGLPPSLTRKKPWNAPSNVIALVAGILIAASVRGCEKQEGATPRVHRSAMERR
jgi:hypothetical protein